MIAYQGLKVSQVESQGFLQVVVVCALSLLKLPAVSD
jgi:hypothetical protein